MNTRRGSSVSSTSTKRMSLDQGAIEKEEAQGISDILNKPDDVEVPPCAPAPCLAPIPPSAPFVTFPLGEEEGPHGLSESSPPSSCSSSTITSPTSTITPSTIYPSGKQNPFPGSGAPDDPYLVDFLRGEHDPANPYNWSRGRKWLITAVIALATFGISFASSSYSAGIEGIREEFGATEEEGVAGLSLYVLGFGLGPLIWAPLSEMTGRRWAFNLSYPFFTLFNIAGGLARNIETMLVVRFLAGMFGSALLTNGMGQVGDLWEGRERPLASSLFCLAPFLGPVIGPVAGGFIAEHLGFRWIFWIQSIYAGLMLILTILLVPETYAPTLVRAKARELQIRASSHQLEKGQTAQFFISKYDTVKRTKWEIIKVGMSRPFVLMFKELIVLSLGLYAGIMYATLYLFFTAFPIVFHQTRGWSTSLSGLAFLGIGLGLILGVLLNPLGNIPYSRICKTSFPNAPPPESRLYMTCLGALLLPVGLFIFAFTSPPSIHFIIPILASVPFGIGYILIFTGVQVYIVDSYGVYAASALAANAVQRGVLATVFPLFAAKLYEGLGLRGAGALLACLSLICTPLPFLFLKYGHRIRHNSKYIPPTRGNNPVANSVGAPHDPIGLTERSADEVRSGDVV